MSVTIPVNEPRAPSAVSAQTSSLARAFLLTGLAWAAVVLVSWLVWWQLDNRRADLARTFGLTEEAFTPYVVTALFVEKLAAKALLFAALYHWLRGRGQAANP
jgi:hypothetical protein